MISTTNIFTVFNLLIKSTTLLIKSAMILIQHSSVSLIIHGTLKKNTSLELWMLTLALRC